MPVSGKMFAALSGSEAPASTVPQEAPGSDLVRAAMAVNRFAQDLHARGHHWRADFWFWVAKRLNQNARKQARLFYKAKAPTLEQVASAEVES